MGTDVITIIGALVSIATLIALVGGGFYWWGRLSSRVDGLDREVQSLRDDVKSVREDVQSVRNELNGELQSVRNELNGELQSVRGELQSVRNELQSLRVELLTEIRLSEERIMTALTHHSHVSPDAGPPVFWQPIGAPNPPSTEAPTEAQNAGVDAPAA